MTEPTTYEARAVLAPRRARLARLALLLPVVSLMAIAWAGFSGPHSDQATANIPDRTAGAASSSPVARSTPAIAPAEVIGLQVHRLDDVQTLSLSRDVAVAGWYVATGITDCPSLPAIYRSGSIHEVPEADQSAFCVRSGVLYASQPDVRVTQFESAGLPEVGVTIAVGVIVPPGLQMIRAPASEVIVVGRFVESGATCRVSIACPREFVVNHVAWTAGT